MERGRPRALGVNFKDDISYLVGHEREERSQGCVSRCANGIGWEGVALPTAAAPRGADDVPHSLLRVVVLGERHAGVSLCLQLLVLLQESLVAVVRRVERNGHVSSLIRSSALPRKYTREALVSAS